MILFFYVEPSLATTSPKKSTKAEESDVLSAFLSETRLSGADKAMGDKVDVQNVASLLTAPGPNVSGLDAVRGLVAEVGIKGDAGLAAQQADPNSPLYAACTFEDLKLPADILKGVYAMKFVRPSAVQARALPLLLGNPPQNVIAQSQSGTGKTAAFVLTMLCRVDEKLSVPQALCLTPARELARQIVEVVREMARFTNITVTAAVREEDARSKAESGPLKGHIVVGTPGTVLDLMRRGTLDARTLQVLVFDEADVMFEKDGMGSQSVRVRKACSPDIQTLLFSATFTDPVLSSARRLVPHAHLLALPREDLSVDAIRQFYMPVQPGLSERLRLLSAIYGLLTLGQSIIFAGSRDTADRIQAHMQLEGFQTSVLHGGLSPSERDSILDAFRSGTRKC
jgi:ATP-dependent RNA helicase DDX19/DBP5